MPLPTQPTLFAEPVLHGPRFGTAEMPLEVLPELAAYRDIIVQLAKERYKQRTNRRAVPKHFEVNFRLHLVGFRAGSTVSRIFRMPDPAPEGTQLRLLPEVDDFDDARDYLGRSLDTLQNTGRLPEDFPDNVIPLVIAMGRTLEDEDVLELKSPGHRHGARYTREVRRRLVVLTGSTYAQRVDVLGTFVGTRVSPRRELDLRTTQYGIISVPFSSAYEPLVAEMVRDNRFKRVQVVGTAHFDHKERLVKFDGHPSVTLVSVLDEGLVDRLEHRLKELEALKPGWFEGEGEVPSREELDWLRGVLLEMMAQHSLPAPTLFPMPEGGVQADWRLKPWHVTAEFDLATRSAFLHAAQVAEGVAETISVQFREDTSEPLSVFAGFVRRFAPPKEQP